MGEFFSFLKVFVMCGTLFFIATLVLLALPRSKLRSVGLEMSKWALALGLLILVPSPVDVIPDVVPGVGWLDDVGYLVAAGAAAKSAWGERKRRSMLEEMEFEEELDQKRKARSASGNGHDNGKEAA